jgi:hypothetical protein
MDRRRHASRRAGDLRPRPRRRPELSRRPGVHPRTRPLHSRGRRPILQAAGPPRARLGSLPRRRRTNRPFVTLTPSQRLDLARSGSSAPRGAGLCVVIRWSSRVVLARERRSAVRARNSSDPARRQRAHNATLKPLRLRSSQRYAKPQLPLRSSNAFATRHDPLHRSANRRNSRGVEAPNACGGEALNSAPSGELAPQSHGSTDTSVALANILKRQCAGASRPPAHRKAPGVRQRIGEASSP